jgi:hypothetical protein
MAERQEYRREGMRTMTEEEMETGERRTGN